MRTPFFFAAACLLATSLLADDKLLSVDEKSSLIVVEHEGSPMVLRVSDKAEILLNGAKIALNQLQPGITLRIRQLDTQTAARIEAQGVQNSKPAPPAAPRMRSIILRAKIDGFDTVHFDGTGIWIEHVSANKPDNFLLNGREWTPQWQGDKTTPFTEFNPPLAPLGQTRPVLKQLSGRNKIAFAKTPAASKGEFAVKIEDAQSGPDTYEFRLSW